MANLKLIHTLTILIIVLAANLGIGLFASTVSNSQVYSTITEHSIINKVLTNHVCFKTKLNINVANNTYLKFTGTKFIAKSIIGNGTLVLDGLNLKLKLNNASNIIIYANKVNILSNLVVNNTLTINSGSKLALNNYNLMLTHQSFNNNYASIIKNGQGILLKIPTIYNNLNHALALTTSQQFHKNVTSNNTFCIITTNPKPIKYNNNVYVFYNHYILPPITQPPIGDNATM